MSHKLVSLYIGEGEYYTRTDADNALAEKDEEIAKLKADYSEKVEELCIEKTNVDTLEQAWKQSQRALWLARAERAKSHAVAQFHIARRYEVNKEKTIMNCFDNSAKKWAKVENLCRTKAEEYK